MNKTMKIWLLSLVAIVQVSIIVVQHFAYEEMSDRLWSLSWAYKMLYEQIHDIIIDFPFESKSNPFSPLIALALFGLFATIVLILDEIRHKNAEN